MSDISVKKDMVEKYTITGRMSGISWSIFTLDNKTGDISIQSDWGNYSYIWNHRGNETLKEFLINAGVDYIKDKFSYPSNGGKKYIYAKETLDSWKRDIVGHRRNRESTKEIAKALLECLNEIDLYGDSNTAYFSMNDMIEKLKYKYDIDFYKDSPWRDDYKFMERMVIGCSPQLNMFMDKVWPVFIDVLKKEKENGI